MAVANKRLMTDDTGQDIVNAIEGIADALTGDAVRYVPQTLTTAQQAQARSNIGATTDADLAIVANGNTHAAIESGQFVYVRNHSTLAEGLYKATAAIGTNAALSTSNLAADSSGGLNDLQGQVTTLNSNLTSRFGTASITIVLGNLSTFTFSNLHDINNAGIYKHGLLIWGTNSNSADCGLSFMFIDTQGNVTIHNIYGTSRTLTGSISNGVLTITSNMTVYGGLKLIWLN